MFYETVHSINALDYSKEQLAVWASGDVDLQSWNESFLKNVTVVVEGSSGTILGFGDMDQNGYLDHLYVHKCFQKQGIATSIVKFLEHQAMERGVNSFTTHASITARPFFKEQGYEVKSKNTLIRQGIVLINYVMEKLI